MTESTLPAAKADPAPVPLDQVMLAMDVVDTLRHRQELVATELDEEQRQREFVGRVQAIYESQGIEVSAAVIAEGVRALREDRFAYRPPLRNWQVRLAELYVERGKWGRRAAAVAALVLLLWAAFAIPGHFRRQGQIDGFGRQLATAMQTATDLLQQGNALEAQLVAARTDDDSVAAAQLLANATTAVHSSRVRAERVRADLTPMPAPESYPESQPEWDLRLTSHRETLAAATADLGAGRALLAGVQQLRGLTLRLLASLRRLQGIALVATEQAAVDTLQRAVQGAIDRGDGKAGEQQLAELDARIGAILAAREQQAGIRAAFAGLATALTGVEVEPSAAAELAELRAGGEQAIAAGDWERAQQQLALLRTLIELLDQTYELRIVSRPEDRSGVWRHPVDRSSARNFYVIVEAIGPGGRALRLPVTSEEDQRTRTVSRFGIRVPESVYEAVKADKLDNGLVDKTLFGVKKRGARQPEYMFAVVGGRITEW